MPRFVVQHHVLTDGDEHWDLMFEVGECLWTWSLPAPPDDPAGLPASARHLPDHRLVYLQYEGDISGDRGRVEIHDRGTYCWIGEVAVEDPELIDLVEFELQGDRAAGRFQLKLTPDDGADLWRLRRVARGD